MNRRGSGERGAYVIPSCPVQTIIPTLEKRSVFGHLNIYAFDVKMCALGK